MVSRKHLNILQNINIARSIEKVTNKKFNFIINRSFQKDKFEPLNKKGFLSVYKIDGAFFIFVSTKTQGSALYIKNTFNETSLKNLLKKENRFSFKEGNIAKLRKKLPSIILFRKLNN